MVHERKTLRLPMIGLMIIAWFVASNHCVVAAPIGERVVLEQGGMPTDCPMHAQHHSPKPTNDNNSSGDLPCCKNLPAVATVTAKLANPPLLLGAFVGFFTSPASAPVAEPTRIPSLLETGPPSEGSFAELVLQRSLLAHAPPVSLS